MRRRLLLFFLHGCLILASGWGNLAFAQKTYFHMNNLPSTRPRVAGSLPTISINPTPPATDTLSYTSVLQQNIDSAFAASAFTGLTAPYTNPPEVGTLDLVRLRRIGAQFITQSNPVTVARTANFNPVPNKLLVQMRVRLTVTSQTATGDSTIATFYLGSNFTDDLVAPSSANTYSKFTIRTSAVNGESFRLEGNNTEIITKLTFARISMAINNADYTFKYNDGQGHSGTLAPDTYDLWVDFDPTTFSADPNYVSVFQTNQLLDDAPVTSPTQEMTDFKMVFDPNRANTLQILELYIRSIEGYLPVELLYFNGQVTDDQKVLLNWATATEKQSSHFLIQRSKDLKTYSDVAKVKAAGNSSSRLAYALTDETPLKGTSYYRLIQVDLDGSEHPYRPVAVRINDDSEVEVYPNPSNGESIHVRVANPEATVQMHSMSGMPVSVSAVRSASDEFTLTPSGPLAQGVYIVTVTTPESTQRKKLVIR